MVKTRLTLLFLLIAITASATEKIPALQKRIKRDRKDILYYLTRITDAQNRMKTDKAKAVKAGEDGPDGKWTARATKESASIEKDRAAQAKAQKDLADAQAELNRILTK
jgi:hypothetical protein